MNTNLPPRLESEQTRQQKALYREREAQLARWRADIATIEANMSQVNVAEQLTLQEQLNTQKSQLEQAEEQLDKMREATGDAWDELETSTAALQQQIADSIEQIQNELRLSN